MYIPSHCYISPSWYETSKAVPTWNYVTVHVYGHIEFIKSQQELIDALRNMVKKYEDQNSPYQLEDVDKDFIDGMSQGIVGFRLQIEKVEGKAKLSQNHPPKRQKLVIQQLEQMPDEDSKQIALLMKENIKGALA